MATDNRNANSPQRSGATRQPRHRRRRVAVAVAIGVMVLGGVPTAAVLARLRTPVRTHPASTGGAPLAPAPPSPARTVSLSCPSPSLGGTLPTLVYLPAGYANSSRRYPVVYFLHGLPANPTSYEYDGFIASSLVTANKAAIVVTPQGARSPNSDREYLDWGATENWPEAISHDLVSCVDRRYRTIADRDGRALTGLSAGGYGAFNIGLRTLSIFGAVESWSGYFAATNPAGTALLNLGSPRANAAAAVPNDTELSSELAKYPAYIGFYVGDQDSRFLQDNETYNATLGARGINHIFAVYPGGHSATLWHGEAPTWLATAIDYLSALRAHHAPPSVGATGPTGTTGTT
jgi:enterochelin esterase-like enzyme